MLDVVVVSPARPVWEGRAKSVNVPAAAGQMGIFPRHADLVAALGLGPLRIEREDGGTDFFAVWGGFLKVGGPKVVVLVDRAAKTSEIDQEKVEKELEETRKNLRAPKSDEHFEELLDRRMWCRTRLKALEGRQVRMPGDHAEPPRY